MSESVPPPSAPLPSAALLNAPLLIGRYQPVELLARGGMSAVFRGRDVMLGRGVAIKVLNSGTDLDYAQYEAELRVLANLSHHGLVSIVDAGLDDSSPDDPRPFLVMELVPGKTLRETLAERPLSHRQVAEIAFDVAETLDYVHSNGVIHRDITPSNVMLVNYRTKTSRERAQLMDFGIAIDQSFIASSERTITGTAAYLSPEQARLQHLTPASDIYSLGLVLLECFTGERAFAGDAVETAQARLVADPPIPDSVPEPWGSLLRHMTDADPQLRPDAAEVAAAARHIMRATTGRHRGRRATDR